MDIKEIHGSIYAVDKITGDVVYEIVDPVALFSLDEYFTLYKIGNRDVVESYYRRVKSAAQGLDLFDDYVLADLPKDAEILNKLYNNSAYLKVLFKDLKLENFQ